MVRLSNVGQNILQMKIQHVAKENSGYFPMPLYVYMIFIYTLPEIPLTWRNSRTPQSA